MFLAKALSLEGIPFLKKYQLCQGIPFKKRLADITSIFEEQKSQAKNLTQRKLSQANPLEDLKNRSQALKKMELDRIHYLGDLETLHDVTLETWNQLSIFETTIFTILTWLESWGSSPFSITKVKEKLTPLPTITELNQAHELTLRQLRVVIDEQPVDISITAKYASVTEDRFSEWVFRYKEGEEDSTIKGNIKLFLSIKTPCGSSLALFPVEESLSISDTDFHLKVLGKWLQHFRFMVLQHAVPQIDLVKQILQSASAEGNQTALHYLEAFEGHSRPISSSKKESVAKTNNKNSLPAPILEGKTEEEKFRNILLKAMKCSSKAKKLEVIQSYDHVKWEKSDIPKRLATIKQRLMTKDSCAISA